MEDKAISKTQDQASTTVHEMEHTDSELYKVGIYTTAAFATAFGVWGVLCLSSAVLSNGGPVELARNLFQSITGM